MSDFTPAVTTYDAASFEQQRVEALEEAFPGWDPAQGGLVTWLNKADSRIDSIVANQAASSSAAMFKKFGESIARVPPILAAPAIVTSTWTAIDTAGHTIEDGTEVKIEVPGGEPLGFIVVGDVEIPPGSKVTGAGEVLLQAIEPGATANGLENGASQISSRTAFVESIALVGKTSGGVDEEDEDAYLDRLTEELQLLSLSLITQRDFEIDARAIPGIARAVCIPGYNPLDDTLNNPLMFGTAGVDELGAQASTPAKEALLARQTSKVPSGVVPRVFDPTYTKVDVTATYKVLPGYDPETVAVAAKAVLVAYFSPTNWGLPEFGDIGSSSSWVNRVNVYINELISLVDRVAGVDRVIAVVANRTGKTLEAKDFNLLGRVSLPEPGAITAAAA